MKIIEALESIEAAPQGNARLEALRLALTGPDRDQIKGIFNLALSGDITFGVKKLPKPVLDTCEGGHDSLEDCDCYLQHDDADWYEELASLCGCLSSRETTGLEAQREIAGVLGWCSPVERKWTERVLRQDLRLNIGAKEVNKVAPGTIRVFEVPLATAHDKCKPRDFRGKWAAQAKIDGARCVAVLSPYGMVRLLSRTGKAWLNFESVRDSLSAYWKAQGCDEMVCLDGEVVCLDQDGKVDFQGLQKVLHAEPGSTPDAKLHYYVFDACVESEWLDPKQTYDYRRGVARTITREIAFSGIEDISMVPGVAHYDELEDVQPEDLVTMSKEAVVRGFEGLILRRLDLPVENRRGKRLIKVKNFKDAEFTVTGTVEGQGRLEGMLGALVCQTGSGARFEAGSGFSDRQRRELWGIRGSLVDKQATIKYFELTDDGIPRFPIFKGIRHPEDK